MGNTSNKSKQCWNANHYTQVKVSVPPELAADFKAKCSADGVSMASEISRFMRGQSADSNPSPANPYATRQQRRKALAMLIGQLEAIMDAEQSYQENIPENLQNGSLYDAAEQTVSALDDALNILGDAY